VLLCITQESSWTVENPSGFGDELGCLLSLLFLLLPAAAAQLRPSVQFLGTFAIGFLELYLLVPS